MGKRGFQPKKKSLRVLTGKLPVTLENLKDMPKLENVDLSPPEHLGDDEKIIWNETVGYVRAGGLHSQDRVVLEQFCILFVQSRKVDQELKKIEREKSFLACLLIKGEYSDISINPLVMLARQLRQETLSYAIQLGLTPAARAKLQNNQINTVDKKINVFRKIKEG